MSSLSLSLYPLFSSEMCSPRHLVYIAVYAIADGERNKGDRANTSLVSFLLQHSVSLVPERSTCGISRISGVFMSTGKRKSTLLTMSASQCKRTSGAWRKVSINEEGKTSFCSGFLSHGILLLRSLIGCLQRRGVLHRARLPKS